MHNQCIMQYLKANNIDDAIKIVAAGLVCTDSNKISIYQIHSNSAIFYVW